MSESEPIVEKCPNCGAPLSLDADGLCRWCRARVETATQGAGSDMGTLAALLGEGAEPGTRRFVALGVIGDITLPLPADTLLVFLASAAANRQAQEWLAQPDVADEALALVEAVAEAGKRANVAAKGDEFAVRPSSYTLEETQLFHLARDLLSTLATLPGLDPSDTANTTSMVRDIDSEWRHRFHKARRKLGDGPAAYPALRALIPPS